MLNTPINFERNKLNQAMYQKLKKYIMNKRKERNYHDAYFNKLKKEREERHKQAILDKQSIEKIKKEASEISQKLESLKSQRNDLFERLKLIANEESCNRQRLKQETEQILSKTPSGPFNPISNRQNLPQAPSSREKPQTLPQTAPSPQLNSNQTLTAFANVLQQTLSGKNPNASTLAFQEMVTNMMLNEMGMKNVVPNQQFSSGNDIPPTQHQQPINSSLSGQIVPQNFPQMASINTVNHQIKNPHPNSVTDASRYKATLELLKKQPHQLSQADLAILTQMVKYPTCGSLNSSQAQMIGSRNMPSANSGPSGPSSILPPAQMSYRGSITTGQSSQQIQLQQQLKQQQNSSNVVKNLLMKQQHANSMMPNASVLFGGPNSSQQIRNNPHSNGNQSTKNLPTNTPNPQQFIQKKQIADSVFSNWDLSVLQKAVQEQQNQQTQQH